MNLTLLILAAGMGSRYGGLKQVDSFGPGGEAIIDYSIFDALRAGFNRVVFVIRKDIETSFRECIGRRFEDQVAVNYVFQELDALPPGISVAKGRSKPWGTTHAILTAAGVIREPFVVINADDFYGREAYQLLATHLASGAADYAMVGFTLQNTLSEFGSVARGVCGVDKEGFLRAVQEVTRIEKNGLTLKHTGADGRVLALTGQETVSMNCWGFTSALFGQLEVYFEGFLKRNGSGLEAECYIPSAVNDLIASRQAKVRVLRTADAWCGVTYREDRPRVVQHIRQLIRAGIYPEKLRDELKT